MYCITPLNFSLSNRSKRSVVYGTLNRTDPENLSKIAPAPGDLDISSTDPPIWQEVNKATKQCVKWG